MKFTAFSQLVLATAALLVVHVHLSYQQPLPCPTNLACPTVSNLSRCLTLDQLCDVDQDCPVPAGGGLTADEGGIGGFDCGREVYICNPATGEEIALSLLCNGNRDCDSGEDETTSICDTKCRGPYAGGCPAIGRTCTEGAFDGVNCQACLPGLIAESPATQCYPQLVISGDTVIEGPQITATVSVTLSNFSAGLSQDVTVPLSIIGGSASAGDHGGLSAANVTFLAGEGVSGTVTRTVSISIVDDSFVENPETLVIQGEVPLNGNLPLALFFVGTEFGDRSATAEVIINDTDVVIVEFTQAQFNGSEDAQSATVSLRLATGSAEIPAAGLDVTLTTSSVGGNAVAGVDYSALVGPSAGNITFVGGETAGTERSIAIPITDDDLVEESTPEVFFVTASELATFAQFSNGGSSERAHVYIIDNDALVVAFAEGSYDIREDLAPLEVCVEVTANTLALGVNASVTVSSSDLSATQPSDYLQVLPQLITFSAGSLPGTQQCINIDIVDDGIQEPAESFLLNLFAGLNSVTGDPNITTVNILDSTLTCRFSAANYAVTEGNAAQLTLILEGTPAMTVEKTLLCQSGTAQAGSDFALSDINQTVMFPANVLDSQVTVSIGTLDDGVKEDDESFSCSLAVSTNAPLVVLGNPSTATITIQDNDDCVIGFVPPPGEPPFAGMPSYTIPEESGPATVFVGISSGSIQAPRIVQIAISTAPDSASGGDVDYSDVLNQTLTFSAGTTTLSVPISITNDNLCELDERLQVSISTSDSDVSLDPSMGYVTILDDDVAQIGTDMPEYSVYEFSEDLYLRVLIENAVRKAPGQSCPIQVSAEDDSAESGVDYMLSPRQLDFDENAYNFTVHLSILDDLSCEDNQQFYVVLTNLDPNSGNCAIPNPRIPVTIVDDEDCCDPNDLCAPMAECVEYPRQDNFTCICSPPLIGDGFNTCMGSAVGDDPHFSIGLPDGKMLCYTVQGEHGFVFNLISNDKVYMNAKFVPDSRRDEVTWLGSMGIVVQSNGYKKANATAMRFEAIENKIYINDKVVLQARNIDRLTFKNGKLMISEAPPVEGFKYPKVLVNLEDVELSFSVAFMNEHLDLYWHSTGQQSTDSHGLIGQFFRKGVEVDEVRKILILPGKEPVPVMRRPVWSFMERETIDDQLCWTAMNPGYQGDGLIDGKYLEYLVDDVLSSDFTYKPQSTQQI